MRRALLVPLTALALLAGLVPLGASPAVAQTGGCLPAGGAGLPAHGTAPSGDFVVLGRGWGHGVGMSQYGAQGAARLGCSAEQILRTYYTGVDVATRPEVEGPVVVGLFSRADVVNVAATAGAVPWRIGSTPIEDVQPQGATWRARWDRAADRYVLEDLTSGTPSVVWEGGSPTQRLQARLGSGRRVALPAKSGRQYARGDLEFWGRTGDAMSVAVRLPTMNQYLYGLDEVPSLWPAETLKAQAITGRSYAAARRTTEAQRRARECRCDLVDTPADQNYTGYTKEAEGGGAGQRWTAAVDATPNRVLWHQGAIATGYYSSTHGGQSESNAFSAFFNPPAVPYLRPIDDTRWEAASDSQAAGVRTWAQAYSKERVGQAFGVGVALSVTLPSQRGAGGRVGVPGRAKWDSPGQTYGGVRIVGTTGERTVSGLEFVNRLGVPRRSELFTVQSNVDASVSCLPTAPQSGNTVVSRASGPGRIETAVAVSSGHWPTAADVVLATAGGQDDGYADALSAAVLAARLDAPLLLTGRDQLASAVRTELARLSAQRVHVMGGTAAISAAVADRLQADGYTVQRVSGPNRFATAAEAARRAGASPSGDVALALGTNWPDAVSAGTLAASRDRVPTLLTTAGDVPDVTMAALAQLSPQRVLVIGGTGVVSEAVVAELRAAGHTVARLSGSTRFSTSTAVVRNALARGGSGARPVLLASGGAFPDALAAGALGARLDAPIALVPTCNLDPVPDTRQLLRQGPFDRGVIVGGTAAVSDRVRQQAADDLRG